MPAPEGAETTKTTPVAGSRDSLNVLYLLLDAVDQHLQVVGGTTDRAVIKARLATLTPREHEVLGIVVNGETNKIIADELGISLKTLYNKLNQAAELRKVA